MRTSRESMSRRIPNQGRPTTMSDSIANRADRHVTAVASISTMSSGRARRVTPMSVPGGAVADRMNQKQRTRQALIDVAKALAAKGRPVTIADCRRGSPSIGRHGLPLLQPERPRARGSHSAPDHGRSARRPGRYISDCLRNPVLRQACTRAAASAGALTKQSKRD